MSLRKRLLVTVLSAVGLVWLATSVWFVFEVRQEARDFLDVRLVESARMVRALLARGELGEGNLRAPPDRATRELEPATAEGTLACQIWSENDQLLAISSGAPQDRLADLRSGFSTREINGTEWRVYALPAPEQGVRILVGEQRELRRQLVADIAAGMLLPFIVLVPLIAALVWYGIGRGLLPLERLGHSIERRDPASLTPVAPDPIPREVRPLVASINRLFARLRTAFDRERQFTSDAAHELRTPLAALKAHVQIARAAEKPADRERALAHLETAADRAAHLVEALLTLARLEIDEDAPQLTPEPESLVDEVISQLSHVATDRDITLRLRAREALPALRIAPSAFETGLRNLVENALRYAPVGGSVIVAFEVTPETVRCEVRDNGPGIPEAELQQVRERFRRGSNAVGHGSGLGLSIVDRIAARYGGAFDLENAAGGGLVARLVIPRD